MLAIGQASHAWISGQLARAWGNQRFGALEPCEEVCLAAEQHDVGMASWDVSPTRNPDTGLPLSFTEMPIGTHLELWSQAPQRLLSQSSYAALLVSMHGMRLYQQRDLDALAQDEAERVRTYLREQRELEERLLASLRADPASASAAVPDSEARNSDLIWTWDFLSLALCLDWAPTVVRGVPTATGPVEIELSASSLHPWPFSSDVVKVHCEGKRLTGTFGTDRALALAFRSAPVETVAFELRKA